MYNMAMESQEIGDDEFHQNIVTCITDAEKAACKLSLLIWFDGEYDSNQTTYERWSNRGKIAVLAKSVRAAKAMLMLLRVAIDEHDSAAEYCRDMEWKTASDIDLPYLRSFQLDEEVSCELHGHKGVEQIIINPAVDTDIWTLPRLKANTC